jgi:hypothetical protein
VTDPFYTDGVFPSWCRLSSLWKGLFHWNHVRARERWWTFPFLWTISIVHRKGIWCRHWCR